MLNTMSVMVEIFGVTLGNIDVLPGRKFGAALQKNCSAAQQDQDVLSRRAEGEELREAEAGGENGRRGAAGGEL
jgi:hypothetical protein